MSDKVLRIGARGQDGLAKAVQSDNGGNLRVVPASSRVRWVDHLSQTLTAGNNTTDAWFAYRDIADAEYIDIYVKSDQVYTVVATIADANDLYRFEVLRVSLAPALTGKNVQIYRLKTKSGDPFVADRLNVTLINGSGTTANIEVKYRIITRGV